MSVTTASFKTYFSRGQFSYSETLPVVRDQDIQNAITEATCFYNAELYPDEAKADLALTYLTAYFLENDIGASVNGAQAPLLQQSRGADGINESLHVPESIKTTEMAFLLGNYYGMKFVQLSLPYLGGAVYSVPGATQP